MTPAQTDRFLEQPNIAHVVTLRADGSAHVVPVWYAHVDGTFFVFTPATSAKVKNLARDPRLTISIASDQRPYNYVVASGVATLNHDDVLDRAASIAARYEGGPEGGQRYIAKLSERFTVALITMTPDKVAAWSAGS
jgi:PPOX class probable F420-dependent enzyme